MFTKALFTIRQHIILFSREDNWGDHFVSQFVSVHRCHLVTQYLFQSFNNST